MAHVRGRHKDLTLRTSQHILRMSLLVGVVLIADSIFIIVILFEVIIASIEVQRRLLILITALCFSYGCKFTARNSSRRTRLMRR